MSARDELAELLAGEIPSDIYACNRVWEAWSYGTMSQDDFTPANEESDLVAEIADAVLAAGYRKSDIIGYLVVGKSNDSLDWDDKMYESEQACIDSLCGPYQDFTREPDSECYWGNEYKLCPVLSPEVSE
ncbi:hypothetical protein [Arthrobacter sp. ok362]|uniref:hypothetical protein n=1 Tax=Arthrobacter sp. ok362 TaxID=1761745 RepID=UPI000887DA10|nr:hypothetical protein [Arthrobacter sp. ok362]SDK80822.1 hypothetical protein SAMN04487913_103246 [Arthrobacter sp. ok362]